MKIEYLITRGLNFFFPNLKTPYTVIHNGFNPVFFNKNLHKKIPNSFISVALTDDFRRFQLKGIDKIFFLANEFQECTFTVVGLKDQFKNKLKSIPKNIEILSFLSQEDLLIYLNKSEFYILNYLYQKGFQTHYVRQCYADVFLILDQK